MKKVKPDGSKTLYVSGSYSIPFGDELDKTSSGTVTKTTTYCPAGGALRINIVGGSNTLYYILKDHLGSASVITDASGNIVGEQRYYPYGETRLTTGTIYTDKLFTGQREITGLGIYHYGARFYSPKLGRFLSADTIVPNQFNPQELNRFSYVRNNPVRYTDPTGHMIPCEPGDVCRHPDPTPPPPPPNPEPKRDPDPTPPDPNPNCVGCTIPIPAPPCSSSMCNPNLTWPFLPPPMPAEEITYAGKVGIAFMMVMMDLLVTVWELSLVGFQLVLLDAGPIGVILDVAVIAPAEFLLGDFGVSFSLMAVKEIDTGRTQEFNWTFTPALFSMLPENMQKNILQDIPDPLYKILTNETR